MSRSCADWQEEMQALSDNTQQCRPADVQEHLHVCPACREWLAAMERTRQALQCWDVPAADAQLTARFQNRLDAHLARRTRPSLGAWLPRLGWAVAVVLITGVSGIFWQSNQSDPLPVKQANTQMMQPVEHKDNKIAPPVIQPDIIAESQAHTPVTPEHRRSTQITRTRPITSFRQHTISNQPIHQPTSDENLPDATTVAVAMLNETTTVEEVTSVTDPTEPAMAEVVAVLNDTMIPADKNPEPEYALLASWAETL